MSNNFNTFNSCSSIYETLSLLFSSVTSQLNKDSYIAFATESLPKAQSRKVKPLIILYPATTIFLVVKASVIYFFYKPKR
jgi:hypothetical protein